MNSGEPCVAAGRAEDVGQGGDVCGEVFETAENIIANASVKSL
jgi:hypothetical protein